MQGCAIERKVNYLHFKGKITLFKVNVILLHNYPKKSKVSHSEM